MKRLAHIVFVLLVICLLPSCSDLRKAKMSECERVVGEWKSEGWIYSETLGTPNHYAMSSYGKSDTASLITAKWHDNGEDHEKVFNQKDDLYLVLSFFKTDGDSFVIVMKKSK